MPYRRADIIAILSKVDHRSKHCAGMKLKTPAIAEAMQPIPQDNAAVREYEAKEIVRARLLIAAQDAAGLRYEDLEFVNAKLTQPLGGGEWNDPAIANASGLDAILYAAANDVTASLEIEIGYAAERRIIRVAVNLENWRSPHRAWDALNGAEGVCILATTRIPASRLAREVLAEVA